MIVPVIKDVDRKSIGELATELQDLAARTREGKVTVDDLNRLLAGRQLAERVGTSGVHRVSRGQCPDNGRKTAANERAPADVVHRVAERENLGGVERDRDDRQRNLLVE